MLAAPPALSRTRIPLALASLGFAVYAIWSVCLHRVYLATGYDLGIFEQAVRSYTHGRWPVADLKGPGFPLLGDHFHPVLLVLAPLYALHPAPETLLIAQAALLALSAVPVTRCALSTLGTKRGTLAGAGYLFSSGLLNAVTFDFHEICFAVPLVAFSAERLLRREWGAAVACAAPLVLVKEDLPLTLAAVGAYVVWQGQRRWGWAVAVAGMATTVVLVVIVLPALNPAGHYAFAGRAAALQPLDGLGMKSATLALLFVPTAFAGLRSPLSILLVPTLAWRFLSSYPNYWGPGYHYNAVLMPIAFLAAVDGLRRASGRIRSLSTAGAALTSLAVIAALLPGPPPAPSERAALQAALARIPDGATVAAGSRLAPHLTRRCRVLFFPEQPDGTTEPDWVITSKPLVGWPSPVPAQQRLLADLVEHGYTPVIDNGTVLLLRRR
ncbi:DUF2079 domain-containing protein [Amycolatopsis taiwanensis]|uniref:DUF2079 domain-containing protein n=1 Tax=Amycolatopsis taiwanensis TaxID=342230 RepID=A0A9W6R9G9_9PSEU|nr:DUF2079 domain-containing protein [Amycolatopsis taiwanensis]GLY70710.1 hypothetical protein Atai01_73290 [Amycolatopsis taiwanensis]